MGWSGVGWEGVLSINVHVVVLHGVNMLHGTSWDMVAWDAVDSKKKISFRLLVVCCTKKPSDEHATGKED